MKKFIVLIIIATLCLSVVSFTACDTSPKEVNPLNSTSGLVAFSSASSAIILDDMSQDNNADSQTPQQGNDGQNDQGQSSSGQEVTDTELEEIKAQLAVIENFIGQNTPSVSDAEVAEDDKYYGTYARRMTVKTKDMHGTDYEFDIYYNEVLSSSHEEKDDDDKFDIEKKSNFKLEGIVISGENEYAMTGTKKTETETEGFEEKTETSYKMKIAKNESEYVLFEQQYEQDGKESETSFEYKIYQDGQLVKKFELEYENENGKDEVEMTSIENGELLKVSYETRINKNGKEVIEAKIIRNGETVFVTICPEGDGSQGNPYRHEYKYGGKTHVDYDD